MHSTLTDVVEKYYYVRGHKHDYVDSLHQKYAGPIVRCTPDSLIHKANGGYRKSNWYLTLVPPGVLTLMNITDPKVHTVWRRLLGGPFQDNYLQKLEPVVEKKMPLALSKMDEELETKGRIDENQYLIDYLEGLGPIHAVRTTMPMYVAIASYLRLPIWTQDTIKSYKSLLEDENPKPTLFTPLFAKGDKDFTDQQIIHLAGSNITAGSHTTATVMTYMIWAVAKHADVRDKLVAEISKLPENFNHNHTRDVREVIKSYRTVPESLETVVYGRASGRIGLRPE
ncbi:hypothetical protein K490DRAFT_76136 [Saccharata proteae CBS 121410]|uniref:Cytochrome P450 n=1 Tax=Saccharata proteae CBS 121410 TaxID=1314787 RepID=A0A9P4HPE9_9PEZI|nr:hypothetical protein K490DRAFT_76136 [Saccharata proteae CBS 121410]